MFKRLLAFLFGRRRRRQAMSERIQIQAMDRVQRGQRHIETYNFQRRPTVIIESTPSGPHSPFQDFAAAQAAIHAGKIPPHGTFEVSTRSHSSCSDNHRGNDSYDSGSSDSSSTSSSSCD